MEEPYALGSKSENPLRSQLSRELLGSVEGRSKPQRNECLSLRLTLTVVVGGSYFGGLKEPILGCILALTN